MSRHHSAIGLVGFAALLALGACSSDGYIAGGIAATAAGAYSPSQEVEQVHYLGVFDPEGQVPTTLYRVTVRGQASLLSRMRFASGWVPANLADSLNTSIRWDEATGQLVFDGDAASDAAVGRAEAELEGATAQQATDQASLEAATTAQATTDAEKTRLTAARDGAATAVKTAKADLDTADKAVADAQKATVGERSRTTDAAANLRALDSARTKLADAERTRDESRERLRVGRVELEALRTAATPDTAAIAAKVAEVEGLAKQLVDVEAAVSTAARGVGVEEAKRDALAERAPKDQQLSDLEKHLEELRKTAAEKRQIWADAVAAHAVLDQQQTAAVSAAARAVTAKTNAETVAKAAAERVLAKAQARDKAKILAQSDGKSFLTGRRLVLFGPEGFRDVPQDHRLVFVMGSSPEGYFEALGNSLGAVTTAEASARNDAVSNELFKALVAANEEVARLERLDAEVTRELVMSTGGSN